MSGVLARPYPFRVPVVRRYADEEAVVSGYAILDLLYPYAGPCLICGGPDKRHRLADSIIENVRAGDSERFVADAYSTRDFKITERTVAALVYYAFEQSRRKKARWPR